MYDVLLFFGITKHSFSPFICDILGNTTRKMRQTGVFCKHISQFRNRTTILMSDYGKCFMMYLHQCLKKRVTGKLILVSVEKG